MNDGRRLILASGSPYKRRLLGRLGIPFRAVASRFEERDPLPGETAARYTRRMAVAKARRLARRGPEELILAADQVACLRGRILRKPGSLRRAEEQLLALAGREHRLVTGVALVRSTGGRPRTRVVTARLRLRPLTRAEARRYVERERPLDCAGAYKIEGPGIALFDSAACSDPTAIEGLPLISVCRLLRLAGFPLPA